MAKITKNLHTNENESLQYIFKITNHLEDAVTVLSQAIKQKGRSVYTHNTHTVSV